jgi:hypothetical protein
MIKGSMKLFITKDGSINHCNLYWSIDNSGITDEEIRKLS